MKKDFVKKGKVNRVGGDQSINHVLWARQNSVNQDCQKQVDVKALTGRGNLSRLRQQVARIDEIVRQMNELAKATKSVAGLGIYLVVHQRTSNGYVFLRWRERLGSNRHLNWDEVDDLTRLQTQDVRSWCRNISVHAQSLNSEHLQIRESIKKLRKEVESTQPHIYPRSLF